MPTKSPSADCATALRGIRSLIAALSQSARRVEQRTGITNAQLFLLREIAASDGSTVNELAAKAMTGQNTVSSVLTRLESKRLVARQRANADGRVVRVALTSPGRRLLRRAPEPVTARLLDLLCNLSPSDLRTVCRALDVLNTGLGLEAGAEAAMLFEADANARARRPGRRAKGRVT